MCPKGDAGRHGTVGEKGPNGLPVGIKSVIEAAYRFLKCRIRFWWIHFDFLFQGLQGKAGAKGSKGEVVSNKGKQTFALESTFVIFYFVVFRVILANLGRRDPLESQVFLYVSDGFLWGGGYNGATVELNRH